MRGLGRLSTFDPLQGFVSYRFVLMVLGLAQDVLAVLLPVLGCACVA
jgi:hypothetical protein